MSDVVQIVSYLGMLHISPPLMELREVLKFWHNTNEMVPFSFTDRRTGQQVTGERRGKLIHVPHDLHTVSEDGTRLCTHAGLLKRVLDTLDKLRYQYTYEHRGPAYPVPEIAPWIVEGLRPEQVQAFIAMISYDKRINAPFCGGMAEMTMATGKTHLIAAMIRAFRKYNIVVTTYKKPVVRRLYDGLNEILRPIGIDVGLVQGNIREIRKVTVATDALLEEFDPTEIGVVLMDECHRGAADNVAEKLLAFNRSLKFGFSGTIRKRSDGKSKYLESVLGPIRFVYNDKMAEKDGRVTPQRVYALSVPKGPDTSAIKTETTRERRAITENKFRNKLIREVVDRVPPGQQLIIFVRTIEHIEHLMKLYLPPDFVAYHGQLADGERKALEVAITNGTHKRVISNGALSEGVDTTALDVLISADWTVSDSVVSQEGGRNRRLREGKPYGVIVTFRDEWGETERIRLAQMHDDVGLPDFDAKPEPVYKRALSRMKQYSDRGWPIIEIDSSDQIQFVGQEQQQPHPEINDKTGQQELF